MTKARTIPTPRASAPDSVFARILIGVDGSKQSFAACRQAARLAEPETALEAATVTLFPPATAAALGVADLADRLEQDAGSVLLEAERILGPHGELRRLDGLTVEALLDEAKRTQATLLAIGAPERPRLEEIVLGGVGGELLHRASCAVLLARHVPDVAGFPRSIVVGIDGSDEADRAYEVAQRLASRRQSTVRNIVALGGKHLDVDRIQSHHPGIEVVDEDPLPALLEASSCADLLVVGSRGLHGLKALGSVSERVAHEAACSVLVTRRREQAH